MLAVTSKPLPPPMLWLFEASRDEEVRRQLSREREKKNSDKRGDICWLFNFSDDELLKVLASPVSTEFVPHDLSSRATHTELIPTVHPLDYDLS